MTKLNLTVPTSFEDLTQRQLFYYFFLVSSNQYNEDEVKSMCLLRFANVEVERNGRDYLVVVDKRKYNLRPRQIAEVLYTMDWMFVFPDYPVRIDVIQRHAAKYDKYLHGLTFEQYTNLENLYQGYLYTKDESLITEMAFILYGKMMKLSAPETYSVFYWFSTLKRYLSNYFPHFFTPAPVPEAENVDLNEVGRRLEKQLATQLRALTKGDITKQAEILHADMWTALEELDAQAEEYEQMKKQMKQ